MSAPPEQPIAPWSNWSEMDADTLLRRAKRAAEVAPPDSPAREAGRLAIIAVVNHARETRVDAPELFSWAERALGEYPEEQWSESKYPG